MRPARPRRLNKMAARHRFPGCTPAADESAGVQLLKGRGGLKPTFPISTLRSLS